MVHYTCFYSQGGYGSAGEQPERPERFCRKSDTLNLLGNTVTTSGTAVVGTGGDIKITGNGKIVGAANPLAQINDGHLTLESGEFEATSAYAVNMYGSDNPSASNYSTLEIGENASLVCTNSWWAFGITIYPSNGADETKTTAAGIVLDVKGSIITQPLGTSIFAHGYCKDMGVNVPKISIYDGAALQGGIYAGGYCNWNISGGMITSYDDSAFEIKSGKLTMTDGTIENRTSSTWHSPSGSGTSTGGYGLAVVQNNNYAGNIVVNITGGTIKSVNGVATAYASLVDSATSPVPVVNIAGGVVVP